MAHEHTIPKAVFWDMDGTLIDSEPLHEASLIRALESIGISPPADLHSRVLGRDARQVYDMMRAEFGLTLPFDDWIARKYAHYLDHAPKLKPRAEALEIFHQLRAHGVHQAVVSNSDRLVVDANLRATGLARAAMKSVSRNDVRLGKPDSEPFLRAAWLLDIRPADCAVMEDSPTGARGGLAAGMRTIFWPQAPIDPPDGALYARNAAGVRRYLGLAAG